MSINCRREVDVCVWKTKITVKKNDGAKRVFTFGGAGAGAPNVCEIKIREWERIFFSRVSKEVWGGYPT